MATEILLEKTIHVVLNQDFSSLVVYILADLISFLEIQRLQLAGSSSTVFAANSIPNWLSCTGQGRGPLLI